MTEITLVIPAHNEAAIIRTTLDTILRDGAGRIDAVVVANGCTDDTADIARHVAGVEVITVDIGSKIAALNAATPSISHYPVAYVDADVTVSGSTLLELARRLSASDAHHVASPRMVVEPSRSWWIRQYYRVWAITDYRNRGHIGSGVYMLSRAGRDRFTDFPDVIADDSYIQRLFAPDERLTPDDLEFTVKAPGSLRAMVARNTRIAAGNRQLAELYPSLSGESERTGFRTLLRRVAPHPTLWPGFVVYSFVYGVTRFRGRRVVARHDRIAWNRDETTRTAVRS